jgi:ABC-2 type transport system ATP-binding protein
MEGLEKRAPRSVMPEGGKAHEGLVVADSVGMRFGQAPAIDALSGVSFSVNGPSLVCVLGPNGAGKTTLFEVLAGLSPPTTGSVRLFGEAISVGRYPKSKVGVVFQREFLLDEVRIGEYAELFAAVFGVAGGREKILRQANLLGHERKPVARLSGGEQQRLFIAAACVHDPELLLLDEPTSNLDPRSKEEVGRALSELAASRTVLMTTHDLAEAESLAQDVLFLVRGRVVASGPLPEVLATTRTSSLRDAFFALLPTEDAAIAAEIV